MTELESWLAWRGASCSGVHLELSSGPASRCAPHLHRLLPNAEELSRMQWPRQFTCWRTCEARLASSLASRGDPAEH